MASYLSYMFFLQVIFILLQSEREKQNTEKTVTSENSGQLEIHLLSVYHMPPTSPRPKQTRMELRMELGAGRTDTSQQ